MAIMVAGGAGFIASNFILDLLTQSVENVINLNVLTYGDNLENLSSPQGDPRHIFVRGNIGNFDLVACRR